MAPPINAHLSTQGLELRAAFGDDTEINLPPIHNLPLLIRMTIERFPRVFNHSSGWLADLAADAVLHRGAGAGF
jgi:hypothetical protein